MYRGRLAPTPSGYMHWGHVQTFRIAHARAQNAGGKLVLRMEDLDASRCKPIFYNAWYEDLKSAGINWDEGPDKGGPYGPYLQSERYPYYLKAWACLKNKGLIYPCQQSRKDVQAALSAPHTEEPLFPIALRTPIAAGIPYDQPKGINWRFQVPDGLFISFNDNRLGPKKYIAGKDFGDFLIWRKDDIPTYELAVVVDDHHMQITEVVRGEDLLISTARQILLYQALNAPIPAFYHTPLIYGTDGQRLSKRNRIKSHRS
jgi:glutamyl/glutaminyl-tRNA synthetase